MPKNQPMKNRVIRVSDDLWEAFKKTAEERGEYMADAIRDMLTDYVQKKA